MGFLSVGDEAAVGPRRSVGSGLSKRLEGTARADFCQ